MRGFRLVLRGIELSALSIAMLVAWGCTLSAFAQAPDSLTAPEIRLNASVDRTQVPLNRTVLLTVELSWSGNLDRYEVAELEDPVVRNFKIVGTGSSNRVDQSQGLPVAVKRYTYTLQPQELGMGYIEGMAVLYTDTATGKSHRLLTQRLQVEVVDPLPEPGQHSKWYPWAIGLVVLAAVAAGYFGWRRRARGPVPEPMEEISLEQRTLAQLHDTIDLKDPSLDLKAAYADLSRIARQYLGQKLGLPALERTTDELLAELQRTSVDERLIAEAQELLRHCDRVKFGGQAGDRGEFERFFGVVEKWLTRPRPAEIESEQ